MELLKLEDVSIQFDGRNILHDLNLSVKKGTIHSILGTNAAGKSSLAYAIVNCCGYAAQSGKIYFDGKDITSFNISQRAKLGLTLAWQEPAKFEGLSVKDYIQTGMKEKDPEAVDEALRLVLLEPDDYRERATDETLSGGERKRIELAAVYAMAPKLAVLDEPDSGIDILALESIANMIKSFNSRGTTVLLITHREEIAKIADTTSLMCSGSVVQEGPPAEMSEYFKINCVPCPTKVFPGEADKKEPKS